MRRLYLLFFAVIGLWACSSVDKYEYIQVEAPFEMPQIGLFQFPNRSFSIVDYGALPRGEAPDEQCIKANIKAFDAAMKACNQAGGGKVVVPSGEWPCGPIHFKSNCNLFLSEGAVLCFSDNPDLYLPAVQVSWEGLECMNYSPLVYAFQCENIAISGHGKLAPVMDTWRIWFDRPKEHLDALGQLYEWASFDYPVEQRQMAVGASHLRPHLIHFNQCKHVLLEDFQIKEAPFWTIHLFRCDEGVVRRLNVFAHGHNNDGVDLEMTKNFLVEDCKFDQGDDAVVIKSGRNRDAWRIHQPTENIVIRNCHVQNGHGLLVCGSELSGGIRNVYMHDCTMDGEVNNLFYFKTNIRRGGVVENIQMKRVKANRMRRVFAIDTDVLYQWASLPTYKDSLTTFRNIVMDSVICHKAKGIYEINGVENLPPQDITLANIHVDSVSDFIGHVKNTEKFQTDNITWDHGPEN